MLVSHLLCCLWNVRYLIFRNWVSLIRPVSHSWNGFISSSRYKQPLCKLLKLNHKHIRLIISKNDWKLIQGRCIVARLDFHALIIAGSFFPFSLDSLHHTDDHCNSLLDKLLY